MYIQGQTRKGEMYSRYNKSRTDTDQHADKELYSNTSKFYIDPLKLIIHLSFISRFRKKKYRSVMSCCCKVVCLSVLVSFLKRIKKKTRWCYIECFITQRYEINVMHNITDSQQINRYMYML